jgi:hypothetical protein
VFQSEGKSPVVLIVEDEPLIRMGAVDMIRTGGLPSGSHFLPKPYSASQIVGALRELTVGG